MCRWPGNNVSPITNVKKKKDVVNVVDVPFQPAQLVQAGICLVAVIVAVIKLSQVEVSWPRQSWQTHRADSYQS